MAVNIGSMNYVSTLDNADFQAKTLEDIKLIRLRLQLTGDTAGLKRYDDAFKKAAEEEIAVQKQLNQMLEETRVKTQQVAAERAKPAPATGGTQFSNSAAEVAAYTASTNSLQTGALVATTSLAELEAQLAGVQGAMAELNALNNQGTVSTEVYASGIATLTQREAALTAAISNYNAATIEQVAATGAESAAVAEEIGLLENLRIVLAQLKAERFNIIDPVQLARQNALIQETEAEIVRLNNVGRVGFDNLGNAINRSGSAITRSTAGLRGMFSMLRQIAYILPGIGIAGILGFLTGPIINYIAQLEIFSGRLNLIKQNQKAWDDVMAEADKAAGSQIANLKQLYAAATNVNNSVDKRIEAAKELRQQYAAEFATATNLAIINGKLKGSYDELTKSILENAKAQAAQNKIAELFTKVLDAQYQIDLNNFKKAEALRTAKAPTQDEISAQNRSGGGPSSLKEVQQSIKAQTDFANKSYAESIKIANSQINSLVQYVGNVNKQSTALDAANKLLGKGLVNFNTLIKNASDAGDLNNIKSALELQLKNLAPGDKQIAELQTKIKQVDALLKQYNPKISDDNQANQALQRRIELLRQVQQAITNVNTRQLSEDQSALTAISDKFDQLKEKIAAFNRDPQNKGVKISGDVVTKINSAEDAAITNQANLNENKFIADDIEKKKKLYADYEDYRSKVGSKIADKEYQDLLRSGKDFQAYLTTVQNSIDQTDQSGPIQDRRKSLQDYFTGLAEEQRVQLQQLLVEYSTYQQQRDAITTVGQENEIKLLQAGATEQADQVAKNTREMLTSLDEEQFKKMDSYKRLFDNIERTSYSSAKKQIQDLKDVAAAQFAAGKITAEAYTNIIKGLEDATKTIDSSFIDKVDRVNSAVAGLADSFANISPGVSEAIKSISGLVSIGSDATKSFQAFSNHDVIGGIVAGISALSGIFSLFGNAKEKAEQLAYANDLQVKSIEAVNKALERQLSITKDLQGPERITAYLKQLADIKVAQAEITGQLSSKAALTGIKTVDDEIKKFNNGETDFFINANKDVFNNLVKSSNLAGQSLENLQKMLDKGQLDDKTAALVQSLVDLQQQAIDTQNALNEEFAGTSFDSITQSIVDLFQSATTSAEDFAGNFQKIIQASILNAFKRDYLEKQLQGFYTNLTALSKQDGTLSAGDIATLQAQYNDIIAKANEQFKNIQAATGVIFGDTNQTANQNSLSGSIQASLTEQTGTVLAGLFNGFRLTQMETNAILNRMGLGLSGITAIAQDNLLNAIKIEANTRRTADNTEKLTDMRLSLLSIDKKMVANNNALAANGRV